MENIINSLKNSNNIYEYINELSVKILEDIIIFTSDKYFNDDAIIDDSIFDVLIDFLRNKDPKNKVLKKVGSEVKIKNKVQLPYSLFSMDKIKPPSNKIGVYKKKFKKPYIVSEKLDGISGLLVYKDNKISLFTRGDAYEGTDITNLVKYLQKIPSYLNVKKICEKYNIKGKDCLIAFRGEIIMSKEIFETNWSHMKNARNTTSGLVNSKNINPKLALDTRFVIYEIVDPVKTILQQYELIQHFKLYQVHYKIFDNLNYDILSEYLIKRKNKSKYDIDGIIVTNNDKYERPKEKNPTYAFAFKTVLEDQKANTTVLNIEWNKSKHGKFKPTVLIKPVNIGGVCISRVTGNNANFVVSNKIGKDANIEIIRSGDVIPKIEKVLKEGKVNYPNSKWHWNETGVDIVSDNLDCKDIHIKNIYNFFVTFGTKGLGEKVIEKLYDGGINTIKKILTVSKEELLNIPTIKEKSAVNILNSIKTSTNEVSLLNLMVASNKLGLGMGKRRINSILTKYPNLIETYSKWTKKEFIEKIKSIEGWEDKTSTMFVENFNSFITFYKDLKNVLKIKNEKKKTSNKDTSGKFKNKKVVISGTRDKDIIDFIENEGGIISSGISKNTDILIVKNLEKSTSKVDKAKELNIPIFLVSEII